MTNITISKDEIQNEAIRLSEANRHLLLSWATGCSKSLAAIRCFEKYLEGNPEGKAYLIVKETNHENNWREEFKKWGKEALLDKIEIFCYASLHKYEDKSIDFIILDEVHALSEARADSLKTIAWSRMISLSATVPTEVKNRMNVILPFYEYHISFGKAIEIGLLPEPKLIIHRLELRSEGPKYEFKMTKKMSSKYVYANEYYKLLTQKVDQYENIYNETGAIWAKTRWMRVAGDRKKFLAKYKTDYANKIIQEFTLESKRFICFSGSIDQSKLLGGPHAFNSEVNSIERQRMIIEFNELKINSLYAVGMLRESMNLESIDAALIVQLDNQQKSAVQMSGRAMRSLAPEIHFLIVNGTQDTIYLSKALKGIDKKYIENVGSLQPI